MHIIWKRTMIGGDELQFDFCAYVENINVARIYRTKDSDGGFVWSVNMTIGNAFSGMSLTRREAILAVEDRFAHFLQTPAGQEDPQLWPHDQRSVNLRFMKENDPAKYAILVEELRSGRVERIPRKRN